MFQKKISQRLLLKKEHKIAVKEICLLIKEDKYYNLITYLSQNSNVSNVSKSTMSKMKILL